MVLFEDLFKQIPPLYLLSYLEKKDETLEGALENINVKMKFAFYYLKFHPFGVRLGFGY